jgi:hypothetical protein
MTEFHRWELADRVSKIQRKLEADRASDPKTYGDELERKFASLSDLISPTKARTRSSRSSSLDPHLITDLAKLRREASKNSSGLETNALRRMAAARQMAAAIASSQIAEPLDQIIRVGSPEILDRVSPLQSRFRPFGRELDEIDNEARDWNGFIVEELRKPGHRSRQRAAKESGKAIWNDARTIAYLRWVIRNKLKPNQRLLFITGDLLLFDSYRRWYFERRKKDAPPEPFFFRRVSQYTPLFNPSDSGSDLQSVNYHRRSELFSLMRQVVDVTLIALPARDDDANASITGTASSAGSSSKTSESITDSRLEVLALKQVGRETLADDPELMPIVNEMASRNWSGHAAAIIEDSRDLWQEMERLSIGASFDLLIARMTDEQKAVAGKFSNSKGEETSKILGEYASGVLSKLLQNNFRIWLPLAHSLLDPNFDDPLWRQPQIKRISIGLRLPQPADGEGLNSVASRPEMIFTQAALQAVKHQDVANFVRFSDHALRSMQFREVEGITVDSFEFELKYLNAVAQRISIASVLAHLQSTEASASIRERSGLRAIEQVKTFYGQAASQLRQCLGAHFLLADEDPDQAVRYRRALSERASLHLFIATSFGLAASTYREILVPDAKRYLRIAYKDLRSCVDLDLKSPINDPLMNDVRDQFIPNIAGYEVISYLLSDEGSYAMAPWPRAARKKLMSFWAKENQSHPLLAAELYSFGLLSNLVVPAGRKPNREDYRANIDRLRLPLDRALYKEICEQLINTYL